MSSLARLATGLTVVLLLGHPCTWGADVRLNVDLTGKPQGETSIAVNPNDPQHLVAAWIDWKGNRGQGITTYNARSLDGGATWDVAQTAPDLAPVIRRVDPVVAFDGIGNVYTTFAIVDPVVGAWVLRSTDGGLTFGPGAPLDTQPADKPWIAADPETNAVYGVWVRLAGGIWFSRSLDQAATFSAPVQIASGSLPCVAVGPDNEVYVTYVTSVIHIHRSLDGGATWLSPDPIAAFHTFPPSYVNGTLQNTFWPNLAVDHTDGDYRGRIYVVWADGRNGGNSDIYLAYSANQGSNWSSPVRVNDDFVGGGTDHVLPWVWVDDEGHAHVQFLDRREDPENLHFAVYLATSTDGGASFGPNVRISEPGLIQGGLPGKPNRWIGDYNGGVGAGGKNHIVWADGRAGDLDIFYRTVDDADFDEDGVANDGNGDGQYANARCTGGQSTGCDDNCPGTANPSQADQDGDLVGDACDNCPSTSNTNQFDRDRDGEGDACDPCPSAPDRPAGDPDGDGAAECIDNCPGLANPTQVDADGDDLGDACDPCPLLVSNDADDDGHCEDADNCPEDWNPTQADADGDGKGNVCDVCPGVFDIDQTDADGDGQGDVCDCQATDPYDLAPTYVPLLRVFQVGDTIAIGWIGPGLVGPGSSGDPGRGFDSFSASRGLLSSLHTSGTLGSCLMQGIYAGFQDAEVPPAGDGFFYLVQGENYDCGLGPLGFDSAGALRQNTDPGACTGHPVSDVFATSETTVVGAVAGGSLADTYVADNKYEVIKEVLFGGVSRLEHHWTFDVPASVEVELHLEARWSSPENDAIRFDYSTNGVDFTQLSPTFTSLTDWDYDVVFPLPADTTGTVTLRVIDTEGGAILDSFLADVLWIRSIP